jgi:hypothetical protein
MTEADIGSLSGSNCIGTLANRRVFYECPFNRRKLIDAGAFIGIRFQSVLHPVVI